MLEEKDVENQVMFDIGDDKNSIDSDLKDKNSSKKIVISSSYLYKALLRIFNVIVSKPLVPILEDFFFEINNDTLRITGSDMSTTIFSVIWLENSYSPFKMAVPSKILLEILKNLPEQPVELLYNPLKCVLTVKSQNGKYKIMCDDPSVYPTFDINKSSNPIVINGKKLIEAIESTIIVAGNDSLRSVINSILFEINDSYLVTVATDMHRLVKYSVNIGEYYDSIRFIVPKRSLLLLKNLISEDDVNIFVTEKHIYLESGNDVFMAALIDDKSSEYDRYPDYERVIPVNYENNLFIDRIELLGALKRLSAFTNKINFQIKFSLKKNKLLLIAEDINSENDGVEEIDCNYECQELVISYNIKYLLDLLQNIKTDAILMSFSNCNDNGISNKASIIKPFYSNPEDCNYSLISLIMPIFM